MAKKTFLDANEEIAEKATAGFNKMSSGVVNAHMKVQNTVVGGYEKIEDAFVARFLTHEGETVAEAKERLRRQDEARRAAQSKSEEHNCP